MVTESKEEVAATSSTKKDLHQKDMELDPTPTTTASVVVKKAVKDILPPPMATNSPPTADKKPPPSLVVIGHNVDHTTSTPSRGAPDDGDIYMDQSPAKKLKSSHNNADNKSKAKQSVIDHTYRDFSQVDVSDYEDDDDVDPKTPAVAGSFQKNKFPAKLHAIVSNPAYYNIIRWQPHGRSWKIVDKALLESVVCPRHFQHSNFASFNRSVNSWGFKRLLSDGPDCKSYYHECFLRGCPNLTKLMQRVGFSGRRLPDKEGEPDFYEISKNFPLPNPHPVATVNLAQGAGAAQLAGQYLQHHAPLSPQNPWYGTGYHPTMTLYPQATPSSANNGQGESKGTTTQQQQQQQPYPQSYWHGHYPGQPSPHYHQNLYGGYYPYQHQHPSHPYYYQQHQHLHQHHAPPQSGTATVSAPNSAVMPVQEARSVQSRKAPPEVKSPLTAEEEGVAKTALEMAVSSAENNGEVDPGFLQQAVIAGYSKQFVLRKASERWIKMKGHVNATTDDTKGGVVVRSEKQAAPDKMEAKGSMGNIEEANVELSLPSAVGDGAGEKKEVVLSPMKE